MGNAAASAMTSQSVQIDNSHTNPLTFYTSNLAVTALATYDFSLSG